MRAYIGAKIILAEPMSKCAFHEAYRSEVEAPATDSEGYHVQYTNPDGSKYDSWSPKDVFDRAYRPVDFFEVDGIVGHELAR
jgi:hypothetical protein